MISKKENLYVIKIGGEIIDSENDLPIFLDQFCTLQGKKILVHGGGKLATNLAKKLNIQQTMVDGRRITDGDTLDIVTMVYAGLINKKIVSLLQAKNVHSIGLCGADANLIQAKKRENKGMDYGFVGDIVSINTSFLQELILKDFTPIISPITHNKTGQLLNTNADSITNEIGVAMNPYFDVHIIYCFDKLGVLLDVDNENSVLKTLDYPAFEALKNTQKIYSGMIPKLDNAFAAKKNQIAHVYLGKGTELMSIVQHKTGTKII